VGSQAPDVSKIPRAGEGGAGRGGPGRSGAWQPGDRKKSFAASSGAATHTLAPAVRSVHDVVKNFSLLSFRVTVRQTHDMASAVVTCYFLPLSRHPPLLSSPLPAPTSPTSVRDGRPRAGAHKAQAV